MDKLYGNFVEIIRVFYKFWKHFVQSFRTFFKKFCENLRDIAEHGNLI